jgi:hypothetical protein
MAGGRSQPEARQWAGRGEPVLPRSTWEPMGGCPGHRELSGQAAGVVRPPSSEAFIGRSLCQEHGRLQIRVAIFPKVDAWPPPGISSNFPQGGGGVWGVLWNRRWKDVRVDMPPFSSADTDSAELLAFSSP